MLARYLIRALALMPLLAFASAGAQTYPTKPVRLVTSAAGGGTDFVSRLLGQGLTTKLTGVEIVRVAYKGNGPALIALMGGEVHLMFANAASVSPHVRSGRLRALAVAASKPTELAPRLPTVASAGLQGFESSSTYGVFGPARMPRNLVGRINGDMVNVLTSAEVRQRLFKAGMDVIASPPEALASLVKADMGEMGKILKNAGSGKGR